MYTPESITRTRSVRSTVTLSSAGLAFAVALLAGCGAGGHTIAGTAAGTSLHGTVFGGQQPVVGATIQLYAAGASGYGSAAVPLIPSGSVKTVAGGGFDITGTYTCPSAASQVYITATGGNPGVSSNANLALMTALGPCGNLSASTFISINEVTTIASVWPLAPFMTGVTNIGTTSTNALGLVNAFSDVNTLVNISTGNAPGGGLPVGTSIPVAEINTLADILATCINSVGGLAGSDTPCGRLFTAATPAGGSAPTDTITASMNIAQHPGSSVAALYNLTSPAAPFQPTLATQPSDFIIAATFVGGNFGGPSALASDAAGNIWIANSVRNTVTELSPKGLPLSGTGYTANLSNPSALAIAADGTIWVTNQGNNTVSRLMSTGSAVSGSPYSGGGLNQPESIAFDSLGNAWIANVGGGSVTEMNNSGSFLANFTPTGVSNPVAIAVTPK